MYRKEIEPGSDSRSWILDIRPTNPFDGEPSCVPVNLEMITRDHVHPVEYISATADERVRLERAPFRKHSSTPSNDERVCILEYATYQDGILEDGAWPTPMEEGSVVKVKIGDEGEDASS